MKTLRDIAAEIGIDKSTVFRYVKAAGIKPIAGATMRNDAMQREAQHRATPCNDAQYLATLDAMRKNHKQEVADLESDHTAQLDQLRSDHVKELDRLTDAYKHEVDALTASIDRLTADNDRLQRELSEERQHSREQSDKLAQLCDQSQKLQLASLPSVPALIEDTKPKPSIWQRIFGKK